MVNETDLSDLKFAACQFEEPLLMSLHELFSEKLGDYLKLVSPFQTPSGVTDRCGALPTAANITLDLDNFRGNFPCIVITHTKAVSEWKNAPSAGTLVETPLTFEIDYLLKAANDFCDVIEIHRVSRAIRLLLMHAKPADFAKFFHSEATAKVNLKSPLQANALFLEAGRGILRGVRITAQFSLTEMSLQKR